MSTKRVGTRHNSSDRFVDPGTATDYVDRGPVAKLPQFDRVAASRFYAGVRSQGNHAGRQVALSKLLERARANAALSHGGFRLLEQIVYNARGAFRYSVEAQCSLAHWCGFSGPKNLHRFLSELENLGFIVRISMPRLGGGHAFPIFSPVCTSDDRSGLGTELIARNGQKKRPQPSKLSSATLDKDFNASNLGHATPQFYGQTVDVENKEKIMSLSLSEGRLPCEMSDEPGSAGGTSQTEGWDTQKALAALTEAEKAALKARGGAAREVGARIPSPLNWKPDDRIFEIAVELGLLELERDGDGEWVGAEYDVNFFNREFQEFVKYNAHLVAEGRTPANKYFAWEAYITQRLEWGKWGQ